ncbi:methyltransferase domain-containing protein [bacterium]|nr:methyltransferase domain-containing protein [bacterium]
MLNKRNQPVKRKQLKNQCKVIGPVNNLEDHVHTDWWRKIFNSTYLKTDGDVVGDQLITADEVDFYLDFLKMPYDAHILDLCCGQGRHTLELRRRGYKNVEGLDLSHYLVQKAKEFSTAEGFSIPFRKGDARRLPYEADRFDAVMILGNSFGYFDTVDDDLKVLKEVLRVLKPWGRVVLDITDGMFLKKNFEPRSWEWINKKYFVCRERSLSSDEHRLISREVVTHAEKGVIADQFYAERLYSQDEIRQLLKKAGFATFIHHGALNPNSARNQDLGMMVQRFVLSAQVSKNWTPKVTQESDIKTVAVLMGDPRRPDIIKPQEKFDDDDFFTINRMKEALLKHKKYRFTFLDNHHTFLKDIEALKGKVDIVFNICDEGFKNEPRKELHVPALMDMCEIPYSGGGPQCLAFCYDKSLVRGVAKEMNIPVPEAFLINHEDMVFDLPLSFPILVKPNFGDSSFGITINSVVNDLESLVNAISKMRRDYGYDKPILVEEFLPGMDLSVGIIGNPPSSFKVLPIIHEDYSCIPEGLPRICGYEAKWDPTSPYWKIKSLPANLPEETEKWLTEMCLRLFERLECQDYCRFDWRMDESGQPKLLEVNPNPGWCWDGHLAKMAALDGMSYDEMLISIINAGIQRVATKQVATEKNGCDCSKEQEQNEPILKLSSISA